MEDKNTLMRRVSVYTFLSLVFRREITRDLLANLLNGDLLEILDAGGHALKSELTAAPPEETIEKLAVEYAWLFIGPGPRLHLYESVNRGAADGEPGMLWGEATADVKKFIEFHGLKFKEGYGGIPDHIGIEFEFMARLIQKELELRADGDQENTAQCRKAQAYFFDHHIITWMPQFCHKLKESAEMEFYKAIADYTAEFMELETYLFREVRGAPASQPQ